MRACVRACGYAGGRAGGGWVGGDCSARRRPAARKAGKSSSTSAPGGTKTEVDISLKDVKDKLMKDVMKNDLKDLKDIASKVKRKVEIDFKHKGRLRIKT